MLAGIHRDQVPLLSESNSDEDIDVANERRRVTNQQQGTNNDILVLNRLTKVTQPSTNKVLFSFDILTEIKLN